MYERRLQLRLGISRILAMMLSEIFVERIAALALEQSVKIRETGTVRFAQRINTYPAALVAMSPPHSNERIQRRFRAQKRTCCFALQMSAFDPKRTNLRK